MVNSEQVISIIEDYLLIKQNAYDLVKEYVQNKDIPLEIRWDIFISTDLPNHYTSIVYFDSYDINLDNYRRHETINLETKVEDLEYEIMSGESDMTLEELYTFKEEILSMFVKSFELDW